MPENRKNDFFGYFFCEFLIGIKSAVKFFGLRWSLGIFAVFSDILWWSIKIDIVKGLLDKLSLLFDQREGLQRNYLF